MSTLDLFGENRPRPRPSEGHRRAIGGTDVWLTPPAILNALGPFDLDPCAAPEPRPWPTAAEHYTADVDARRLASSALDGIFVQGWLSLRRDKP